MQSQVRKIFAIAVLASGLTLSAAGQTFKTFIGFADPTNGIAVNPVTNKVYVAAPTFGAGADTIGVIDGSTDTLQQSIPVGSGVAFVTVDYLRNRVYAAGCDNTVDPVPCTVTVIDGKANKVLSTIPITTTPGLGLTGIVANPLNGRVYVANSNDNVINIIDGWRSKLLSTKIGLQGNSPAAIALNPILNRLYVPYGTNLTATIDASKNQILSTTSYGMSTVGVAVNLRNGKIFVTDQEIGPSMTGIFDKNGKVLASIPVDDGPLGVDVDPFTNLAFVASTLNDDVAIIDGSTNTVKSFFGGTPASYIAVNVATQKVYVSGRTGVTVLTEK
jgi:DNA-binding beta-propeller fold protein YncE